MSAQEHGAEGHLFDLRCDGCQAEASALVDARFIESMTTEGLTPEQAQEMLTEARRIGAELRQSIAAEVIE